MIRYDIDDIDSIVDVCNILLWVLAIENDQIVECAHFITNTDSLSSLISYRV